MLLSDWYAERRDRHKKREREERQAKENDDHLKEIVETAVFEGVMRASAEFYAEGYRDGLKDGINKQKKRK